MVFQFQPRNNIDAFYLLCLNKTTHYFTVERTSIGLESLLNYQSTYPISNATIIQFVKSLSLSVTVDLFTMYSFIY